MADLYSTVGQNARRVLTSSDFSNPDTTWLIVDNNNGTYESGTNYNAELTTAGSVNYQAIVECIQQYCEVYDVVRPSTGILSIKVRANSVPYAGTEARNDMGQNSILTTIIQAHPSLGSGFAVWNGAFLDDDINWD